MAPPSLRGSSPSRGDSPFKAPHSPKALEEAIEYVHCAGGDPLFNLRRYLLFPLL